jgi:hypothetical protein
MYMHIYVYICMYINLYIFIYIYICIYIYLNVYTYIYIYIYIYILSDFIHIYSIFRLFCDLQFHIFGFSIQHKYYFISRKKIVFFLQLLILSTNMNICIYAQIDIHICIHVYIYNYMHSFE